MIRRTRLSWRRTVAYTAASALLSANAAALIVLGVRDRNTGVIVAAVAVAYVATVAVFMAASAACSAGWHGARDAYRWLRTDHTGRPTPARETIVAERKRAAAEEAAARHEVAARHAAARTDEAPTREMTLPWTAEGLAAFDYEGSGIGGGSR